MLLLEQGATHLRVPLPEGADQIGKRIGFGFDLRRTGLGDWLDGVRYGWEFKKSREEEDQEREGQHECDGDCVEGLEWHRGY